jgi:hypothetical protein
VKLRSLNPLGSSEPVFITLPTENERANHSPIQLPIAPAYVDDSWPPEETLQCCIELDVIDGIQVGTLHIAGRPGHTIYVFNPLQVWAEEFFDRVGRAGILLWSPKAPGRYGAMHEQPNEFGRTAAQLLRDLRKRVAREDLLGFTRSMADIGNLPVHRWRADIENEFGGAVGECTDVFLMMPHY